MKEFGLLKMQVTLRIDANWFMSSNFFVWWHLCRSFVKFLKVENLGPVGLHGGSPTLLVSTTYCINIFSELRSLFFLQKNRKSADFSWTKWLFSVRETHVFLSFLKKSCSSMGFYPPVWDTHGWGARGYPICYYTLECLHGYSLVSWPLKIKWLSFFLYVQTHFPDGEKHVQFDHFYILLCFPSNFQ